jgi:FKBP-type peptidyl-prolyl cis-trans isomerase
MHAECGDSCYIRDVLTMHYTGRLLDKEGQPSTKFDSSVDRDKPFSFQIGVGQVIPGWDKGVAQMSLGEKAVLSIPSRLGYGARGAPGAIPPHADLSFEVQLLCINDTCVADAKPGKQSLLASCQIM